MISSRAVVRMQLVAVAGVVVLSACASAAPFPASPVARSSSATSAATTQPIVAATPAESPSPADLLESLLARQVDGWAPTGPTLIVTVASGQDVTIVAVPLDGTRPTPLLTVHDPSGGVLAVARTDGGLLAFALAISSTSRRIALFDLARGQARWLTAASADGIAGLPVWAADGRSLYFGAVDPSGMSTGIAHVTLDGTTLPALHPGVPFASVLSVSRVTSDGMLIGADEFNGPTVWAVDLATGQKVSFGEHNSVLWAWRSTKPRGLVSSFTNIAAPGAGYLSLWDGETGAKTVVTSEPVGGADFDPTGTRIVAAIADSVDRQSRLTVMNADGSGRTVLAGTENARSPLWTARGIAYETYVPTGPNEVRIVSPGGGASRTLYTTTGTIERMQLVAPQ